MKFNIARDNSLTQSNNQDDQEYYSQRVILSVHFDNTIEKLLDSD